MTGLTIEYGVPPARRHAARCAASGYGQDGGGGAAAIRFAVGTAGCAEGEAGRVARHGCDCARRHGAACRCRVAGRAHTCRAARAAAEAAADDGRTDAAARTVAAGRASAAAGSAAEAVEAGADPAEAACGRRASGACARCRAASHPRGGPATAAPAAAAPATPAPAPAAPAAPARETAPIGDAAYLRNPAPDYPAFAQDQGWEGRVVLRVRVLANGSPDSVEVRTSSGRRMLDTAAVAAVKRWTFVPAKRGDEAVDGWVNVPIDFKLG